MTPSVFKAIRTTRLDRKVVEALQGLNIRISHNVGGVPRPVPASFMASKVEEIILHQFKEEALQSIVHWAEEGNGLRDYLNTYVRLNDERDAIITTWTFSDRDGALLFKLSLE